MHVLVVDDNVDAADTLSMLLELEGYETTTVHDGFEVLEAALRVTPGVVLMDLEMPGIDGCQVAALLRQEPALANTLLVAVTGFSDDGHRKAAKDAGFDIQLVKPVPAEVLFPLLAQAGKRNQD
jgi:CheY-like chemotaxis protein